MAYNRHLGGGGGESKTRGDILGARKPEAGTMSTLIEWLQGFFMVQSNINTLQAFEQLGALYMHNLNDKHPTR